MLKNIFSGIIGCLVGIVVMGMIVFILQTKDQLDLMPFIMLGCILILVLIGIIAYWMANRKKQKSIQEARNIVAKEDAKAQTKNKN